MRVLPNMQVICPCDAHEAKRATLALAQTISPTYIRLAREKTPIITTPQTPFEIGKAQIFFQSKGDIMDVAIVACGSLVCQALQAAKDLDEKGIKISVINMATIKPLDTQMLDVLLKQVRALVTVEEHQIAGGLGSAIAEYSTSQFPVPIEFVGVKDSFGQSGTPNELLNFYNLNQDTIEQAVYKVLSRK